MSANQLASLIKAIPPLASDGSTTETWLYKIDNAFNVFDLSSTLNIKIKRDEDAAFENINVLKDRSLLKFVTKIPSENLKDYRPRSRSSRSRPSYSPS